MPVDTRLNTLIQRARRMAEEKKALTADEKDIFAEAKSAGYDVPIIKRVIKWMDMTPEQRAKAEEQDTLFHTYRGNVEE